MFLFILSLLFQSAHANEAVISRLLVDIKENSLQMKASDFDYQANIIDLKSNLFVFEPTAFVRGGYSNRDTPPTSPFAPSNSTVKDFEIGVSKQWSSGFSTSLNYLFQDSETSFPSRPDFNFISPTLTLSLQTNIFQDLIYDRYGHLLIKNKINEEVSYLATKIEKKNVLVQGLLDFSLLLEQKEELSLQEELCNVTKTQNRNLALKRRRGSVSKREYLLGQKELINCEATIERLKRGFLEKKRQFASTYNNDFSRYNDIETEKLFGAAEVAYQNFNALNAKVDIEEQDQVLSLKSRVKGLEAAQSQLEAEASINLSFEVRSGLAGLDNTVSNSHQDITGRDYPFVYVGLRLDLPIKNRDAVARAGANRYRLEALKKKKDLAINQKESRLGTLETTLKQDFVIYEKYKQAISFSKAVIKEARRDFSNGRLDFNAVTEFNKSLIQDQKNLSSHRIQLIVRVIEYLDFFQYFDSYLN